MAASSRHPSLSPSPAPASSHDIWTPFDYLPAQLTNSRKRPSHAQLQRLQAAFDVSRYLTKEERNALAREIGLDVKFITVWFQNRRQSDKRKAWTKRDRAKKKENFYQQVDAVLLKPTVSLDQIASRMERPARAVLAPQQPGNLVVESQSPTPTPSKPNTLWAHMPSSPPAAPSSPPSDALRLLDAPCLVKSGKSLEWACAKARVSEHRLRKDKNFRRAKGRTFTPCKRLAVPENEFEGNSDNDDPEASTPSSSQGRHNSTPGVTADPEARPGSLGGKSTEDVEVAMVLLQFLHR